MIAKGDSFCQSASGGKNKFSPSLKVSTKMIMPSCSMRRQIHARSYHSTRARGRGGGWTLKLLKLLFFHFKKKRVLTKGVTKGSTSCDT